MDFPAESYFQPAGSRAESQPLRFPCAAIGLIFAFVDAGAIVFASFVGAGGYQLLVLGTAWNLDFHIGAGIYCSFAISSDWEIVRLLSGV